MDLIDTQPNQSYQGMNNDLNGNNIPTQNQSAANFGGVTTTNQANVNQGQNQQGHYQAYGVYNVYDPQQKGNGKSEGKQNGKGGGKVVTVPKNTYIQREGDWSCATCGFINFSTRFTCKNGCGGGQQNNREKKGEIQSKGGDGKVSKGKGQYTIPAWQKSGGGGGKGKQGYQGAVLTPRNGNTPRNSKSPKDRYKLMESPGGRTDGGKTDGGEQTMEDFKEFVMKQSMEVIMQNNTSSENENWTPNQFAGIYNSVARHRDETATFTNNLSSLNLSPTCLRLSTRSFNKLLSSIEYEQFVPLSERRVTALIENLAQATLIHKGMLSKIEGGEGKLLKEARVLWISPWADFFTIENEEEERRNQNNNRSSSKSSTKRVNIGDTWIFRPLLNNNLMIGDQLGSGENRVEIRELPFPGNQLEEVQQLMGSGKEMVITRKAAANRSTKLVIGFAKLLTANSQQETTVVPNPESSKQTVQSIGNEIPTEQQMELIMKEVKDCRETYSSLETVIEDGDVDSIMGYFERLENPDFISMNMTRLLAKKTVTLSLKTNSSYVYLDFYMKPYEIGDVETLPFRHADKSTFVKNSIKIRDRRMIWKSEEESAGLLGIESPITRMTSERSHNSIAGCYLTPRSGFPPGYLFGFGNSDGLGRTSVSGYANKRKVEEVNEEMLDVEKDPKKRNTNRTTPTKEDGEGSIGG